MPFSQTSQRELLTVSELNHHVRIQLESCFSHLWVTGEISNLSRPASGHLYFTLKDATTQIRCAFFRNRQSTHPLPQGTLENGRRIVVRAGVSLYEPRGDYQLLVEHIEPAGAGELQLLYEQLRQRLAAEGLFDNERKVPIPYFPTRIGVITSPSGAALHDVISVLRRRCPMVPVILYPSPVQGEDAVPRLIGALTNATRRAECDTLILCRGGGAIEDLWSFNSEALARAIAACPIPIISGVGHETDFTIADFVADVRAPTPSVAAELAVPDQRKLSDGLDQTAHRLERAFRRTLDRPRQRCALLNQRLAHQDPRRQITQRRQQLDYLTRDLARLQKSVLRDCRELLQRNATALDTISPLKTLDRGYSILIDTRTGSVVSSIQQITPDQPLTALLRDGQVDCRALSTECVEPFTTLRGRTNQ